MSRKSIAETMAALEARGAGLEETPQHGPAPTEVHRRAVDVLSSLMQLGTQMSNGATPTHLKVLMRTLQASQPMMLDGLAGIPPEQIRAFMRMLHDKIGEILTAPMDADEAERVRQHADAGTGSSEPGSNLA